jgi:CubicO group peptidase (beta-lactamase class C family)
VAALILYERGRFDLADPVSAYLPEFGAARVVAGGVRPPPRPAEALVHMATEALAAPLTILHLFTHTAGLHSGNIHPGAETLAEYASAAASLPLLFEPGSQFRYGEGISVIGRLIEVRRRPLVSLPTPNSHRIHAKFPHRCGRGRPTTPSCAGRSSSRSGWST